MLDHALESAFVAFLTADTAFAGVHFFTGYDDEDRRTPSVTAASKSESLAGSAVVFRSDLTLTIESEAHDSTSAQHAALVEAVRAKLADRAGVAASVNTGAVICLCGYAFAASNLEVEATRFRTTLTFKCGYKAA